VTAAAARFDVSAGGDARPGSPVAGHAVSARIAGRSDNPNGAVVNQEYRSGQTVRLSRSSRRSAPAGEYKIVRALPDRGGEREYRIKSALEPYERVVNESELERV
jgi:hypothetical protein